MIYADTNVLLSIFCADVLSARAVHWFQGIGEPLCVSTWTVIEFRSNLGIRVRKRSLPRSTAIAAMARFDIAVAANFHQISPTPGNFTQASDWLASPECALRSGDALHLAIAFGHQCKRFATFDQPLGAAARKLNLPVDVLKP